MLLDLITLNEKYDMNVKGLLHIGAHYGEENSVYDTLNYPNRMFFEPLKKNFDVLKSKVTEWPLIMVALGAEKQSKKMYVESANQGQSSSLLKPHLHLQQYPHITFPDEEEVEVDTLDNVLEKKDTFNFINMDVQGYELEVLKSTRAVA
jgi:FkbM family methyltransferase